jgi:hypothetical protein
VYGEQYGNLPDPLPARGVAVAEAQARAIGAGRGGGHVWYMEACSRSGVGVDDCFRGLLEAACRRRCEVQPWRRGRLARSWAPGLYKVMNDTMPTPSTDTTL